jgi:hypothetical protein
MATETKPIELPLEQFRRLDEEARKMGLSVPAFIAFLEQCRAGRLDSAAQDAARFMFTKHGESLRKLAQ